MRLRDIALSNLRRRWGKSILIVVGLGVAVAAFVLVLTLIFSLRATMDDRLARYGSNLIVTPASPELTVSYGGITMASAGSGQVESFSRGDLDALRASIPRESVEEILPVLLEPLNVGEREFLAMGTDLKAAKRVKPWWRWEGSLPTGDGEVLLGLNVRNELSAEVGDTVPIEDGRFRVAGVLQEIGGEEDNLVIMPRSVVERLAGREGEASLIEVTVADTDLVDGVQEQIENAVPAASVSSVKRSVEFNTRTGTALEEFGLTITLLVVAIAGLVVMITMLTSVKERRREIGVLRAVGYKQAHVGRLVLLEAVLLSVVAAIIGVAVGLVLAGLAPRMVAGLDLSFALHPLVIPAGFVLSVGLAVAGGLYPARRAANLDPLSALKQV